MSALGRVKKCPRSVALSTGIEDEESEHAALGTAVHSLIEHCFTTDKDAWEHIGGHVEPSGFIAGHDSPGLPITKQMAISAQVMLDAVRKAHPDRNQGNFGVETHFHLPTIHELFYSTCDVWYLDVVMTPTSPDHGRFEQVLHIWDYKNGAGVVVEVEHNEQLMGYACAVLELKELWDKVDKVVLHVVQPNGFHTDGPHRTWETNPEELVIWLEDNTIPAMGVATQHLRDPAFDTSTLPTASGEHCRFCPARSHACPQLTAEMEELAVMVEMMNKPGAEPLTNEQVGRFYVLLETAKIVGKAAGTTAFNRMMAGVKIPGLKLVGKGGDRFFKDGAEAEAKEEFGDQAFTKPVLKSPAQIEELPLGGNFTAKWASKPDNGLTVAKASDRRKEVSPETKALFTDVSKAALAVEAALDPATPILVPSAAAADAAAPKRRGKPMLEVVGGNSYLPPGYVDRRVAT